MDTSMNTTRQRIAICDIDMTIADCTHRLKHTEGENKDWDLFYRLAHYDSPMEDHITFIKRYLKKNDLKPVFVTGRNFKIHSDTWDFVRAAGFDFDKLYMRNENDRRPASEVKRDHLHKLLDEYAVEAVFDDDGVCIEMYKKELKHYPCNIYTLQDKGLMAEYNLAPFYETI